jgi:drug/metabolite transporter (DMT)-like permease
MTFSVLASIIGAASKLAMRKSWIIYGQLHAGDGDCSVVLPPDVGLSKTDSSDMSTIEILQTALSMEDDGTPQPRLRARAISWFLYLCGMIGMSFLNPLCCVLAMRYANPSILAPFSGLTLVWVILFSGMVVGEYPTRSQKVACALIVFGEVIVALFGDHTNANAMSVDEVIASYVDPAFIVFMISMVSFVSVLRLIIKHFPKTSPLKKFAWGSLGGAITGFQNYLKDSLTIFEATKRDGGPLPAMFYLLFIMAVITGFAGLLCLSACMKRYDATYGSAMFVVSFVITTSSMSAIHYHTFAGIGGERAIIMYLFGLCVLIYGATILVRPRAATCIRDKAFGACIRGKVRDQVEAKSDSDHCLVSNGGKEETLLETCS